MLKWVKKKELLKNKYIRKQDVLELLDQLAQY